MEWRSLKIINILTAIAILLIIIIGRIFFPLYDIFSLVPGALFWAILYINLRRSILNFIDAHRNTNIRIDPKREKRSKQIQYCTIILWLFFSVLFLVFAWVYMRAQVMWAVFFIYGILLLVLFYNLFSTVTYLVAKKPAVNYSSLAMLLFFVFLFSAFAWIYMNAQFVFAIGFLILIILLLAVFSNIRDAIHILKMINDKPVDLKKERLIKIINYLPVITIIALVVIIFLRINVYFVYLLLLNLIGPFILLMIIANTWKFISDISVTIES
jgi:hypothetical protein